MKTGTELTKENDKYKQNYEDITPPYVVIDKAGNLKEVKFKNVIFIKNADELGKFRDKVNKGNSFAGYTVMQVADIDLSSVCGENIGSWEPIGTGDVYFAGTYDGMYHTINNLYIDSNQYQNLGLFTKTSQGFVIKNIMLENVHIRNNYSNGEVHNCAGGIIGYCDQYGKIEKCGIFGGEINAIKNFITKDYYGCFAGGIVGEFNNGSILQCFNSANIYCNSVTYRNSQIYMGGIIGYIRSNINIEDCYNVGNVTYNGGVFKCVGGIAGGIDSLSTSSIIKNCYNKGELSSSNYTGGMLGYIGGKYTISNSYCIANRKNEETQITAKQLKTYASRLGDAYTDDIMENGNWKYNNGYPILKWQVE